MFSKVYDKVWQILKQNYKSFLVLCITFLLCTFEFPYYIDTPGGLINIEDRIMVEKAYKSQGSFNLAYVSELKATIPTLFLSIFNKDWNVVKQEELTYTNETVKEAQIRDKMLLEESLSNATIVAYKKASKPITIQSQRKLIMYIDPKAKTDLKIGDEVLEVEGYPINNKEEISEILESMREEKTIHLKIKRDGHEREGSATLQKFDGSYKIGIVLCQIAQMTTNPPVQFSFGKQESGPSGGLMSTLAIYNSLVEEDLTHGKTIVGTGTINLDGTVGSIGGVEYKIKGAVKKKAEIFLVPAGDNYEEAKQVVKEKGYDIQLVSVATIDEAITYLKNL